MPLSEEEQRILSEIEANLTATDPALVQQVSETTLYRHAARMIRWAAVGFVAGLVLLVLTLSTTWLAIVGFLVMLGCSLVIERNARKLGRAGMQSLTSSVRGGALTRIFGDGASWRDKFRRDDNG
jgi:Na+-translocating ferredoxin:NAD+ oxidoreductase RnfD subunit